MNNVILAQAWIYFQTVRDQMDSGSRALAGLSRMTIHLDQRRMT
jgi:hypothetical protein